MEYDKKIAELATGNTLKYYELSCQGVSHRKIGKKFGVSHTSVIRAIDRLKKRAVRVGVKEAYTPENGAGAGRVVDKVTTHIKDGEVKQEWIRTNHEAEDIITTIMEVVQGLSEDVKGKSELSTITPLCIDDLVSVYPIFDRHFGMLSWDKETGSSYDLSIAEKSETETFDYLAKSQPGSKEALIVFGGDYFHCDDNNQVTPSHRNKVDVDGRSDKVFGVGSRMARKCVDMALSKHEHVTVELIAGNHDPVLSMALRYVLKAYYENNPRVSVTADPQSFSYYEFGSTLLAFQHGDKMKQERMYQVVTTDKREAWGRVEYCHVFTGHFHRERCIDIGLMKLESLRTTIPNEAYAHEAGYRSPKTAYAITFSKTGGEVGRTTKNM